MALFKKKDEKKEASVEKKAPVSTLQSRDEDQKVVVQAGNEKKTVTAAKKKYPTADYALLIRPIVSEKTFRQNVAHNQYVFEVAKDTNKVEIKKAFFNVYGVMPLAVNVVRGGGDAVRYGKTRGTSKTWKRAIITLKKGEKIEETV